MTFDVKSSNWSSNKTATAESVRLDYFTALDDIKQVITEPTHLLQSFASCIDLIFTNWTNVILDSGVYLSLYEKYYNQVIH